MKGEQVRSKHEAESEPPGNQGLGKAEARFFSASGIRL
jgi:hypothetical protein